MASAPPPAILHFFWKISFRNQSGNLHCVLSPYPVVQPYTHCQLQAESFSSVHTPACPQAFTENAEQSERSDSLSAWRLRTLGCTLSPLWMCGIGDVACEMCASIVHAQSIPICMVINNRKMQNMDEVHTSTVSLGGLGCLIPPVAADVSAVPYGLHTLCRYGCRVRCAERAYNKV